MKKKIFHAIMFFSLLVLTFPSVALSQAVPAVPGASAAMQSKPQFSSGLTLPVVRFTWIRTTIDPEDQDKDRLRVQADALGSGIGYQLNFHMLGYSKLNNVTTKYDAWFYPSIVFVGFSNFANTSDGVQDEQAKDDNEEQVVNLPDDQKIKQEYALGLLFNFYNGWLTVGATADMLKEVGERQTGFLAQYHKDTREGWQGLENFSLIIGINVPIGTSDTGSAAKLNTSKAIAPR